jgi:hypothetical protein
MTEIHETGERYHKAPVTGVALPWVTRTAAAWALGYDVAVAEEDIPAIEAEGAALVREAVARATRIHLGLSEPPR